MIQNTEDYEEWFQHYNVFRTKITQCKQCKRVHKGKGDVCQECENNYALHKVKKVDDQSEEQQENL